MMALSRRFLLSAYMERNMDGKLLQDLMVWL
jgi:hypothetical protein